MKKASVHLKHGHFVRSALHQLCEKKCAQTSHHFLSIWEVF